MRGSVVYIRESESLITSAGLSFESLSMFRSIITSLSDTLSSLNQSSSRPELLTLSQSLFDLLSEMDADISQAAQSCTEVLAHYPSSASASPARLPRSPNTNSPSSGNDPSASRTKFLNCSRSEVEALCESIHMLEEVLDQLGQGVELERGKSSLDSLLAQLLAQ